MYVCMYYYYYYYYYFFRIVGGGVRLRSASAVISRSRSLSLSLSLSMTLQPFGPRAAFSVSSSYTQLVGLLGRGISPSQDRYLHTEQHKTQETDTDIRASSGI
jgi:hypothetical protein